LSTDTDATLPFNVGDTLAGKYRIDRVLGVGGMGVVVAATHLDLDTKVAIKVMRDELLDEPSAVQRLMLEARAAARIKSEHVARVLDVSTLPSGVPYIVMEFLDGCDLAQLLAEQGALPVAQVADFLLEACEALAEAHAAQIIHRDLKPENLFVARAADGSPTIKVVDFGISKQLGPAAGERALTNPSTAVGSPQYMAPEQMQGRPIDVRADIWALGAILYQAVTGKHAFDGKTLPEVCAKVLGQDPPALRSLKPQLPAELELLVVRCLKKDPSERYADIASFAAALAPLGSSSAVRSMERINRVLKGNSAMISKIGTAPTVALGTTPMAGAATYTSAPTSRNSNPIVLGLVVAAVVIIGAVTFALRSPTPTATATTPTPAASPVPAATPKPPAAESVPAIMHQPALSASAAPLPTPSATPNTAAVGAIDESPAATPSAARAPKKASTKPKAAAPAKQPNLQEAWDPNNFGGRR
jgi:serine/threonine-protein kinase